ncbi:hypothetical protein HDV00_009672 [Rhizophlyctis rosea]|nr:hypothetical protein HDV00_009672 [Rhizophlyctis rosea]
MGRTILIVWALVLLQCCCAILLPFPGSQQTPDWIDCLNAIVPQAVEPDPRKPRFILSNDPLYPQFRIGQRPRMNRNPFAIFFALSSSDVVSAVRCARTFNVHTVARSGGHSYEGFSSVDDGLIVDLSLMSNVVWVDDKSATAKVQPGIRFGKLYMELWERGEWTFQGGTCPTVGLGGFVAGGGYGMHARSQGLGADNVISMDIVLADGRLVTADARHNSDLFWAMRGGGSGSFGIMTSLTVRLYKTPTNTMFYYVWPFVNHTIPLIDAWQRWLPNVPGIVGMQLQINGNSTTTLVGHFLGTKEQWEDIIEQSGLLDVATPSKVIVKDDCEGLGPRVFVNADKTCEDLSTLKVGEFLSVASRDMRKSKSGYASKPLPKEALQVIYDFMLNNNNASNFVQFEPFGGRLDEIACDATPFPNRAGTLFQMQYTSRFWDQPDGGVGYQWIRAFEKEISPFLNGHSYQNYADLDLVNYEWAYYGNNSKRLRQVKAKYDPENFWHNEQSIPAPLLRKARNPVYVVGNLSGVAVFDWDPDVPSLTYLGLFDGLVNRPTYAAASGDGKKLYVVDATDSFNGTWGTGGVTAFAVSPGGALTALGSTQTGGRNPNFLGVHPGGEFVGVSNYWGGNVAVFKVGHDNVVFERTDLVELEFDGVQEGRNARQNQSLPHQVVWSADGRFLYVPDLGGDKLHQFAFSTSFGTLWGLSPSAVEFKLGSGPRHAAFHPTLPILLVIQELSCEITAHQVDTSTGVVSQAHQILSLLPPGVSLEGSTTAEIAFHSNGRYAYASTRTSGIGSIAVLAISSSDLNVEIVGFVGSAGRTPRFMVFKDGYLVVANQDSDNIVVFAVDEDGGLRRKAVVAGLPVHPFALAFL